MLTAPKLGAIVSDPAARLNLFSGIIRGENVTDLRVLWGMAVNMRERGQ